MINVSETFKEKVKDGATPQRILLTFYDLNDLPVMFSNEDIVGGSVQIEQYFSSGEELKYGECPSDTLSFSLFNQNRVLAGFPFGECKVEIGVQLGAVQYIVPTGFLAYFFTSNRNAFGIRTDGLYLNGSLLRSGSFTGMLYEYPFLYAFAENGTVAKYAESAQYEVEYIGDFTATAFMRQKISNYVVMSYSPYYVSTTQDVQEGVSYLRYWKDDLETVYEIVDIGSFIVNRPINTRMDMIDFSDCYSSIVTADADASEIMKELSEGIPTWIEDAKTLNAIAARIWDKSYTFSDNPYADVVYNESPFPHNNTYTKRELLSFIAERLRSVGRIRNGYLEFVSLSNEVVETITASDIAQGSFEAWDVPIELTTGVLLKQEDVSLLFGDGENPYYIYGNPLITTITNDDLSAYKGLPTYYPCSFTVINADPSIEVGDLIDIKSLINEYILIANNNEEVYADENDVAYAIRKSVSTIPLLQRTLTFNGHCSAEYRAVGRMKHELPDSTATNAALSMTGVGSMDQERVFDILTNGGIDQGIYLQDGKIYVNGEYIKANSISADLISGGTIRSSNIDVPGSTTDDGKITVYYSQEYSTSTFSISSILKPGMLVNRGETSYDSGTSSWEEVDVRYDLIQFVTGTDTTREDLSYYGQTSAYIVDSNGFSATILPDAGLSFSDSSGTVLAKYRTSQVQLAHVSPTTTEQSVALSEDIYDFNALCFHLNVGGYNSVMYLPKAAYQNTGHLCLEVIYNLTQYYLFVDVWFISSSVIKYAVRSVGPNWESTTKHLYIYGI